MEAVGLTHGIDRARAAGRSTVSSRRQSARSLPWDSSAAGSCPDIGSAPINI